MRTFIAIELTPEIKQELEGLQDTLKQSHADVKWVKPEAIHLTLKFLGNITDAQAEEIKKAIDETGKNTAPFPMALANIGAFPRLDYPRVIWVGVSEGSEQLIEINQNLETTLEKLGFAKEKRPFHPHLTLGRVRSSKNKEMLKQAVESYGPGFNLKNKMICSQLTLFQSTLTPKGAIYSLLHQAPLKK